MFIISIENIGKILDQSTNSKTFSGADLKKLAKQKEILVKIKNNTTDVKLIYCILLDLDNVKEIGSIENVLVTDIKAALLPATVDGNVKLVKQAITHGADVNTKNVKGEPPLYLAAEYGHPEIVQILLENGASVKKKDNDGNTALHRAASKGYQVVAKLFLQYGAEKISKITTAKQQQMLLKTRTSRL